MSTGTIPPGGLPVEAARIVPRAASTRGPLDPPGQAGQPHHYDCLDAVRAIACSVVVIVHIFFLDDHVFAGTTDQWSGAGWPKPLWPVFYLLDRAGPAVWIFFSMSGFVLAQRSLAGRSLTYRIYVLRRLTRLAVPSIITSMFALTLYVLSVDHPVHGIAADVAALGWNRVPATALLAQELLPLAAWHVTNIPLWTVIYELRISLVFPILLWAPRRLGLPGVGLSLGGLLVLYLLTHETKLPAAFVDDLGPTAAIGVVVLAGAGIAFRMDQIRPVARRLGRLGLGAVIIGGLAVASLPGSDRFDTRGILFSGLACSVTLAATLCSPGIAAFARRRAVRWLSRISFSLYLVHWPVMIFMVRISDGVLPHLAALLVAAGLSLGIAELGYRFVEAPSLYLSRRFGRAAPVV